jgi:hypothetical protein
MTTTEVKFAMHQRLPVLLARGSEVLTKPLKVRALTMVRRDEFEEERGKDGYYFEVRLIDSTGRSWINAAPEQLDPYEPETFASMMAAYQKNIQGGVSNESAGIRGNAGKEM